MLRLLPFAVLLVLAVAPSPASAIFHGTPVPAAETPWLVTFMGADVACGGALVAPDRVLTAAHCVQGARPGRMRIRIGGGELAATRVVRWKGAAFPRTYREVPSPVAPEDPLAAATVDDLAIVVLDRRVEDVPLLPLLADAPAAGEATLTVGRGRTGPAVVMARPSTPDPGRPSHRALGASQVVEDTPVCAGAYGALLVAARHLCTIDRGPAAAQACAGDSGSPVLVRRDGALAVAGVVAWGGETQGRDCGEGLPDVSERVEPHRALVTGAVPAFAPWAERRVRVRRVEGGRLRCVVGEWGPGGVRFRVRWWREGPRRTVRDPRTGVTRILPRRKVTVAGTARTRADRPGKVGCTVTATTAGGWAAEDAYNAL